MGRDNDDDGLDDLIGALKHAGGGRSIRAIKVDAGAELAKGLGGLLENLENDPTPDLQTKSEQIEHIEDFLKKPTDFKVGDRIIRNKFGRGRYRFGVKDQILIITDVFDKPSITADDITHGAVTLSHLYKGKLRTSTHLIDFRYFDKEEKQEG